MRRVLTCTSVMRVVPYVAKDDAAAVHPAKTRVLQSKDVVVYRPERRIGLMLHSLIERIDNLLLEVFSTRVSVDHTRALLVGELVVCEAKDVHFDACCHQLDHGLLELRNTRGCMQRYGVPYKVNLVLRNAMVLEETPSGVRAVDLEPVPRSAELLC